MDVGNHGRPDFQEGWPENLRNHQEGFPEMLEAWVWSPATGQLDLEENTLEEGSLGAHVSNVEEGNHGHPDFQEGLPEMLDACPLEADIPRLENCAAPWGLQDLDTHKPKISTS